MVSQRAGAFYGGAEVQALRLARALVSLGVDVQIVTTKFVSGLANCETLYGVPVRRLAVVRQDRVSHFLAVKVSQCVAMAWYVAMYGRAYDIVHAHCLSASSLGAALSAQLSRLPIIILPSVGGAEGELQAIRRSSVAGLLLRLLRRIDRFAVQDREIADELLGIGVSPERCIPVKNGVDLHRFHPVSTAQRRQLRRQLGLPEGPLALFVGRLVAQKGIRQLLAAWQFMPTLQKEATLVIVGAGPDVDRVLHEAGKPSSRVIFLGTRDNIAELMQAADVLVLPSPYEAFGNVVLEALATGLPVIACRTGVAQQLAIDGVAGRLIEAAQPADLCRALHELLATPDRNTLFRAHGPPLAAQFDMRHVAQEYLAIYETMVQEKQHRARSSGQHHYRE